MSKKNIEEGIIIIIKLRERAKLRETVCIHYDIIRERRGKKR